MAEVAIGKIKQVLLPRIPFDSGRYYVYRNNENTEGKVKVHTIMNFGGSSREFPTVELDLNIILRNVHANAPYADQISNIHINTDFVKQTVTLAMEINGLEYNFDIGITFADLEYVFVAGEFEFVGYMEFPSFCTICHRGVAFANSASVATFVQTANEAKKAESANKVNLHNMLVDGVPRYNTAGIYITTISLYKVIGDIYTSVSDHIPVMVVIEPGWVGNAICSTPFRLPNTNLHACLVLENYAFKELLYIETSIGKDLQVTFNSNYCVHTYTP